MLSVTSSLRQGKQKMKVLPDAQCRGELKECCLYGPEPGRNTELDESEGSLARLGAFLGGGGWCSEACIVGLLGAYSAATAAR
eukprot:gene48242-42675_t